MEPLNLEEILQKIKESYEQQNITKHDFEKIAGLCLNISNSKINDLNYFDPGEINPTIAQSYILAFNNETKFKGLKTSAIIDKTIINQYVKKGKNLPIYFGIANNKLFLQIGSDDGSFVDSDIKRIFTEYCIANNPNKHGCPEEILIDLKEDLEPIQKLLTSKPDAIVTLLTAVNLSNDVDMTGRVSVVLNIDKGTTTIKSFDTFQLSPP